MQADDRIAFALVITCVAVSLPLAITHVMFKARQISETWRKLAHRHRLHFEPGGRSQRPLASGPFHGRSLRMGHARATQRGPFFVELSLRGELPEGLHLTRLHGESPPDLGGPEGALARLGQVSNAAAEARLEDAAKIEPKDSDAVRRYLTKRRRAAALRLATLGGELEDGTLTVIISERSARQLENLDALLHEVRELAPALDTE